MTIYWFRNGLGDLKMYRLHNDPRDIKWAPLQNALGDLARWSRVMPIPLATLAPPCSETRHHIDWDFAGTNSVQTLLALHCVAEVQKAPSSLSPTDTIVASISIILVQPKVERIRTGRNMQAQRQDSPIDWPDNQLMIEHSCQRFCPRSSSLHFAESKNAIQIQCFKTTNAIDPILQDTFEMGPNSISSELVTNIVCHGWRKYVLKQKGFNEEPDQNYYKKHESCQFSFSIEIVIL